MSDRGAIYDALVDHAARYWAAEEENARRRAARVNLLLTVGVAIVGLGLYKLGTDMLVLDVRPSEAKWTLRIILILGLASFIVSVWHLLHVTILRRSRDSTTDEPDALEDALRDLPVDASFKLRLDNKMTFFDLYDKLPEPATADWVKLTIFFQTYEAADELTKRNAYEKARINLGQIFLLIGFVLIVAALCVYTLFGRASTQTGVTHATRQEAREVSEPERQASQPFQQIRPDNGKPPPGVRQANGRVGSRDSTSVEEEPHIRQD